MSEEIPFDTPASCLLQQAVKPDRRSRVINRAYVRQWALDYAKSKRSHPFRRVSDEFLNAIESATKAAIRDRIDRAPSKGVTLK